MVILAVSALAACGGQPTPLIVQLVTPVPIQAPPTNYPPQPTNTLYPTQQAPIVITVIVTPAVIPPVTDGWYPCPNYPPIHMHVGMWGYASYDPPFALMIRDRPSFKNSNIIASAPPGTSMYLLDGPYCDDVSQYIYWHVELQNGVTGYGAETNMTGKPWILPR
jgi:hypothetical protein